MQRRKTDRAVMLPVCTTTGRQLRSGVSGNSRSDQDKAENASEQNRDEAMHWLHCSYVLLADTGHCGSALGLFAQIGKGCDAKLCRAIRNQREWLKRSTSLHRTLRHGTR